MTTKMKVNLSGDEVCLVTGGAGFIGSHLVRELVNQGKKVIVFDFIPDARYIADCMDKITFIYGDVADMPHLMGVMADYKVGLVFHLAYMLVPDTNDRMGWAIQTNCAGFQNVMEAARILKIRRVMWASSQAVYGKAEWYPNGPVNEDMFVNPYLVYGACKLFNEHVARYYQDVHGVDNIGFRKTVAFGLGKSRMRDYSIAHLLVENAVLGRPLEMPPVDYSANWLYVKDIVRAYLLGAQAPKPEHRIFNIGGFVYPCSQVVETLKGMLPDVKMKKQTKYILSHPIEVFDQDQSRAKIELGYEPVYKLEDAVKDYQETVNKFGEQYKSAWTENNVIPLP
jgi:nucleoside-diphosphate-sugar epimerase